MQTPFNDLALLGFDLTGDIGPLTAYTNNRGRAVMYPRASPLNPPTIAQVERREYFAAAATSWCNESDDYRATVKAMAKRAALRVSGYNLYCTVCWKGCYEIWETVCRQTGLYPEPPPYLGGT